MATIKNRGCPANANGACFHGCYGEHRRLQMKPQFMRKRRMPHGPKVVVI